jgi:hypothetical protein
MSIGNTIADTSVPRQSLTARAIARGVRRMLAAAGHSTIEEMRLPDARRADIVSLSPDGSIHIVEIKSCLADFRADQKWRNYLDYCDQLYFALDLNTPEHVIPEDVGLIIADDFGARIVRVGAERRLAAARRKTMTLRFARTAADRLHGLHDPRWRESQA